MVGFVDAQLGRQMLQIGISAAFWQHDRIGPRSHHGRQIVIGEAGRQIVDADDELRPARPPPRDEVTRQFARRRLVGRGYRILQIEDQRVGAGVEALVDLALRIAGNEKQRAHQAGFLSIMAWRVHFATSTSFWL